MKYLLSHLGALLIFVLFLQCSTTAPTSSVQGDPPDINWERIDSLIDQGMIRSALDEVEKIVRQLDPHSDDNPDKIKAAIYQARLDADTEDVPLLTYIEHLKEKRAEWPQPGKSILTNYLADAYEHYLMSNRWKIQERTTGASVSEDQPEYWSMDQFTEKISSLYLQSVSWPGLKEYTVDSFRPLLKPLESNAMKGLSLYEMLSHRAVDYFTNPARFVTKPTYAFIINDPVVFETRDAFTKWTIDTKDTSSNAFRALRLFQDLLSEYGDSYSYPAVLTDLERLSYARQNAEVEDSDSLYLSAMKRLEDKSRKDSSHAIILFRLAEFYHDHPERDGAWRRAFELCEKAIASYPKSIGARNARNLKAELLRKELSIQMPQIPYPDRDILCLAEWRNIASFRWKVYRLSEAQWNELQSSSDLRTSFRKMNLSPENSDVVDLPREKDLMKHRVEWGLPPLEHGFYVLTASPGSRKQADAQNIQMFQVSPWAVSMYPDRENFFLRITDRMSGNPQAGLTVEFYRYEREDHTRSKLKQFAEHETNERGEINLASLGSRNVKLIVRKGNKAYISDNLFNPYRHSRESSSNDNTYLFTDRAIYRPGQTVYFKALLTREQEGQYPEVQSNKSIRVTLRDANHQELKSLELKTNDFGSAQGSFVLPESGLTGRFVLESSHGHRSRKYIRVEEYKRPSFEVELEQSKTSYQLGDTLSIQGVAANYAGNPVNGGAVSYKVVRREYIYRPWSYGFFPPPGGQNERIITVGGGQTDADGRFEIEFPLIPGTDNNRKSQSIYSYEIEAEVTDLQGETQSATRTLKAGRKSFYFKIDHEKYYTFEQPDTFTVHSMNWDGQGINKTGQLALQLLQQPDRLLRDRMWQAPDRHIMDKEKFSDRFPLDPYHEEHQWENWAVDRTVQTTVISTNQEGKCPWILPEDLPAGTYRIVLKNDEEQVELERHFQWNPVRSDHITTDLFTADIKNKRAFPGETIELVLSSALESLPLIVRIKRINRPVEIRRIDLHGEDVLEIPVSEKDRGGLAIDITGNGLNRTISKQFRVDVPWNNKKLDLHWKRIRDELLPGEQTEWTLQITAPDQSPAQAEFLATLYDASLDAIEKNNWSYPNKPGLRYNPRTTFMDFGSQHYRPFYIRPNYVPVPELTWPEFIQIRRYTDRWRYMESVDYRTSLQEEGKGKTVEGDDAPPAPSSPDQEEKDDESIPTLRENFDETVFFFPQMYTDSNGLITLNFQMNEALTRWRLMGFAHTRDLKMGRTEHEVLTNQDFMVFPNLPRFLREGDRIRFSTKVVNRSDHSIQGEGRLVLTDLVSGEEISSDWIKSATRPTFDIGPKGSDAIAWTLQVPEDFKGVLQVEIMATAGKLTDGERHTLPVVSEDMLVTETLPLPVGSNEDKSFDFKVMDEVPPGSDPHRFTLEFTPNPAWYAVKALPWLANPQSENSEQIFNQLFANELAAHIAGAHPAIKDVFALWKKDEDALESELLKNQELKQSLLEETPWVMDALRETEQRKQIARLFEPNQIDYARSHALKKLKDFQLSSGAFPWFKGGRDNFYISLLLLDGFGRLHSLGILKEQANAENIIEELITYCDEAAIEWFEKYHHGDDETPPYILLKYLKARSEFMAEHPLPKETNELTKTLFEQITQYWQNLNLFGQGLSVLIMHRYDFGEVASNILKSIEERALYDDEMGMYWRANRGYYWYQRPIERHVLLMQCFHELRGADDSYEQQRIWLLKQKQTQHWETSKSTASAVFALLMRGEDWLTDQKKVVIRLGGEEIQSDPSESEAGSGYIKKAWTSDEIESDFSDIDIENPNDHIAWGAAYYQYFAPMSAVTASESEDWSIEKSYYQLKMTDEGKQRVLIDEGDPLEVGDKVLVRLEVSTDRTVNYVHIKDMRISGMEPVKQKSGYSWSEGVGYYENPRDMAMHYFMDYMPKGSYVFEYELYAQQSGSFSAGTASIQCYYAPEFAAHSAGMRLFIEE